LKINGTKNFLETDKLQTLTQEEMETLNKVIIINEKESTSLMQPEQLNQE
jgi:hypothetical protein